MGQKVNPIGLRLEKTNRSFDSSWYSDYHYSDLFTQDLKIKFYINNILRQIQYPDSHLSVICMAKKIKVLFCYLNPQQSRRIKCARFQLKIKKRNYLREKKKEFLNLNNESLRLFLHNNKKSFFQPYVSNNNLKKAVTSHISKPKVGRVPSSPLANVNDAFRRNKGQNLSLLYGLGNGVSHSTLSLLWYYLFHNDHKFFNQVKKKNKFQAWQKSFFVRYLLFFIFLKRFKSFACPSVGKPSCARSCATMGSLKYFCSEAKASPSKGRAQPKIFLKGWVSPKENLLEYPISKGGPANLKNLNMAASFRGDNPLKNFKVSSCATKNILGEPFGKGDTKNKRCLTNSHLLHDAKHKTLFQINSDLPYLNFEIPLESLTKLNWFQAHNIIRLFYGFFFHSTKRNIFPLFSKSKTAITGRDGGSSSVAKLSIKNFMGKQAASEANMKNFMVANHKIFYGFNNILEESRRRSPISHQVPRLRSHTQLDNLKAYTKPFPYLFPIENSDQWNGEKKQHWETHGVKKNTFLKKFREKSSLDRKEKIFEKKALFIKMRKKSSNLISTPAQPSINTTSIKKITNVNFAIRRDVFPFFLEQQKSVGNPMPQKFSQSRVDGESFIFYMESFLINQLKTNVRVFPWKTTDEKQSPLFLAQEIVYFLQKRIPFRRIKRHLLENFEWKFVKGIRICCSGRVGGRSRKAQRSRQQTFQRGETSLHVFSSKLSFASKSALTIFGKIGIKVWICYK